MLAADAAKAQGGRLPLDVLLGPAIKHAREGYTVTRSQARLTTEKLAELKDVPGFATAFLVDGKPPEAGSRLKQGKFADTLEHLAQVGLDDFYRGDVGREIAADLERIGAPVTRGDFERLRASVEAPLSLQTAAGTLYNSPPPTQGLASLIILGLFERLRVTQGESFEHVHGLVEATKRAFRVRDRLVTDPDRIAADLNQFLVAPFLDAEAERIDRKKAAPWPAPQGKGDTVWIGAADASGLVVSYIQSLYWEFGSGVRARRRPASSCRTAARVFPSIPRRSTRWRPASARSTRLIRRSRHSRTAASSPTAPWAAMASRRRKPRCSRGTSRSGSRSSVRSRRRAGCSAAPGGRRIRICGWNGALMKI